MESIGSYTNLAQIGKGGMGVVYKADNPDSMLTPVVAVKVLFGDFTDDERRRFLREARVAHELRHENIVTVFDLKETALEEDDGSRRVPYIVMEYLSGVDLRSKLAERDFDSFEDRVDLMIGVARGVAFAHEKDIIHRDIKPSNIQVTDAGLPKILDFGLARTAGSDLTMPGVQPGTPNYMSPEQVQGKEVDQRSDIFSLGAVFYEILTYKRAFGGRVTEAVQKVMKADPPPIGSAVRFVPSDLCDLVHMMLEKSPRKRPQAMPEIVDKLEFARRALPVRINAIRQQASEYLQQISELKEKHRDVLEASGDDDVEATLLISTKVSIDPSEEATLIITTSPLSYIEVWNENERARIELERLRVLVGDLDPAEQTQRTEVSIEPVAPEQEESTDSSGASLIGKAALGAILSTGEFVLDSGKRALVAAGRVIDKVRR